MLLYVEERCNGCGSCVANCPMGVLEMTAGEQARRVVIKNYFLCIGCYTCVQSCKTDAMCLSDPYTLQAEK